MNNEQTSQDDQRQRDAEDQLVDWGLRTSLGDETAPDLSQRIAAAVVEQATSTSSTQLGTPEPKISTSRYWLIGLAATLLLGLGGMFAAHQAWSPRTVANRPNAETSNLMSDMTPGEGFHAENHSLVNLPAVTMASDEKSESKDLIMMVTPGIVIEEGEEAISGTDTFSEDFTDAQSSLDVLQPEIFLGAKEYEAKTKAWESKAPMATSFGFPITLNNQWTDGLSAPNDSFGVVSPNSASQSTAAPTTLNLKTKLEALVKQQIGQGLGPEQSGDKYKRIHENPFVAAKGTDAVSTFSIDVDTASYSNVRQYLTESRQLPPPDAVRLEELVNYFDYDYAGPDKEEQHPFAAHTEVAGCPWNEDHRLVRVAIKGREVAADKRPLSNLVFLVDVSGSMNEPKKLPLVVEGLSYMTNELGENDRVAIVVYAGSEGLALPSTRGDNQDAILAALQQLSAGGSTAGGAGIKLAYQVAEKHFIKGGSNRVILCTDGDFNVGLTSEADLERLAEQKAAETGVFLTVLGFGRGNLNDAMMETISNRGNGTYHYVDNLREARRVLVQQLSGTLVTIAKDVKIQVEFNPANVSGYRLLGYENRMLARQDFNDDTKDAGEVGAGHTVTAIYEVVPKGVTLSSTEEPLKYQQSEDSSGKQDDASEEASATFTDELLTLRLRYKLPAANTSTKMEFAVKDNAETFSKASTDFRFAASVAGFGMLLRDSRHKGDATFESIRKIASQALGKDERGYRAEFLELVEVAGKLQ